MSQQTSRIRPILLRKLKTRSKKSWKRIAGECHVHSGTIKRWLAGKPARLEHIGLLATALGVPVEVLILPDGEEDQTDYVNAEIDVDRDPTKLINPQADIAFILEQAQKAIGTRYRIMLMYVGDGSIKIGIRLHANDAMRLVRSYIQGRLRLFKVTFVTVKSDLGDDRSLDEALSSLPPEARFVIEMYYGIRDGHHHSFEQIAAFTKTSRSDAIDAIRQAANSMRLRYGPDILPPF